VVSKTVRRIAQLVAVLLITYGWSANTVAAGSHYDLCQDVCTSITSCNADCSTGGGDLPLFDTDCGTWNDGLCENTCETSCNSDSDPATECTDSGGSSSTCEDYGTYLHCGDDVCAGDEDTDNCSADCGADYPLDDEPDAWAWAAAADHVLQTVDVESITLETLSSTLSILQGDGMISIGSIHQWSGNDTGLIYYEQDQAPCPKPEEGVTGSSKNVIYVPVCPMMAAIKKDLEMQVMTSSRLATRSGFASAALCFIPGGQVACAGLLLFSAVIYELSNQAQDQLNTLNAKDRCSSCRLGDNCSYGSEPEPFTELDSKARSKESAKTLRLKPALAR
jgi:hypothetical protein